MTPSEVKALLARYGISPTKSKGQNFLLDERVADREVEHLGIVSGDVVLEVGPGLGILTERVLASAKATVCIELDAAVAAYIRARFGERVELIQGDALEVELPRFDRFISNIPYSISSPLIFRILGQDFRRAVIMVQKEFADRMAAEAGSDDYSRLSVNTYYRARCELLDRVPRSKFWPQPEVDSTVVSLEPRPPPFEVANERFFLHLVNLLFQHRRKKIGTVLKMTGQANKDSIPSLPYVERRVEELSPEMIGELADAISLKGT
ncbi:MAG: 16S rRNA (adenine(1518)-N(6)/adenine(1519)-N(6))-dimethyltransferase RsmA [Methanomassiliicoccales archaeon]|nr:16S rRNA (adenine(1518)-N(6)/adenine(1519)-N(6))-dimethyltransferase RsmA [Methanomassiliicoccales archaeon]MDD1755971.1 16S rRNA (adenine(1518)-N(6)/adenine(1519)-N(6))-dimethyltransferase RsmA [Methanomassiliicoccales archaeon]